MRDCKLLDVQGAPLDQSIEILSGLNTIKGIYYSVQMTSTLSSVPNITHIKRLQLKSVLKFNWPNSPLANNVGWKDLQVLGQTPGMLAGNGAPTGTDCLQVQSIGGAQALEDLCLKCAEKTSLIQTEGEVHSILLTNQHFRRHIRQIRLFHVEHWRLVRQHLNLKTRNYFCLVLLAEY